MRGIDFIQIPTTTLSQIDSSIGGKVAINLDEVKNIVGAFYQPKIVFIDPDTLKTLPRRHYINGLVEALKEGLIYDASLFDIFEHGDIDNDIDTIIEKALCVKKDVVEKDEKEMGLRKIFKLWTYDRTCDRKFLSFKRIFAWRMCRIWYVIFYR